MSETARQRGQLAPWLILAFLLHAGLAWWLSDEEVRRSAVVDAKPAVLVRLLSAPEPAVAPEPTPPPPAPPVVERRPPPRPAPAPESAPPEPAVEPPPPVEAVVESEPVPEPESSLPAIEAAPAAELELPPAPASGPPTPTEDELERYKALVLSRIEARKRYPLLARRRGVEGTVTIHIAIADTGALALYEQVGDAPRLLAKPTRQAVEKAGPFPPPPGGALELRIPVDYRLE